MCVDAGINLIDTADVYSGGLSEEIGEGHSVSAAQVALAWLLGWPGITSAIVGARTNEQLAGEVTHACHPDQRVTATASTGPAGGSARYCA